MQNGTIPPSTARSVVFLHDQNWVKGGYGARGAAVMSWCRRASPVARSSPSAYLTETVRSVFQMMSTLSPTLTLSNTAGSMTRRLYFHPFGASKVADDAPLSMATMLAVILRTITFVPLVCSLE